MGADHSQILPYVIALFAVFLIYRRLRRSFGRQLLRPIRMQIRMGMLVLLGMALVPLVLKSSQFLFAEIAGVAGGIALGIWGARSTRFSSSGGCTFYIPHTYSGIVISLLFLGRLAFRLTQLYALQQHATETPLSADAFGSHEMVKSPLTVSLLCAVIGYYLCYYGFVLWKSKHISPEDGEVFDASPAAPP